MLTTMSCIHMAACGNDNTLCFALLPLLLLFSPSFVLFALQVLLLHLLEVPSIVPGFVDPAEFSGLFCMR